MRRRQRREERVDSNAPNIALRDDARCGRTRERASRCALRDARARRRRRDRGRATTTTTTTNANGERRDAGRRRARDDETRERGGTRRASERGRGRRRCLENGASRRARARRRTGWMRRSEGRGVDVGERDSGRGRGAARWSMNAETSGAYGEAASRGRTGRERQGAGARAGEGARRDRGRRTRRSGREGTNLRTCDSASGATCT